MKPTALEKGTFWVADIDRGTPPIISSRIETRFQEIELNDLAGLQTAPALPTLDEIRHRFQTGRRCFGLKMNRHIVAYGWVSRGTESVGELERVFHFQDGEVYVWDCGTVPDMRGNRLYSSLLSQIVHQLHDEGVRRVWIGASRENAPSVQGIQRAGFQHIVDMIYRRYGWLKIIQFYKSPDASVAHLSAAYRILLDREWRLGSVAVGIKIKS